MLARTGVIIGRKFEWQFKYCDESKVNAASVTEGASPVSAKTPVPAALARTSEGLLTLRL